MSVTALREKDWVFNAFWVACGESSAPRCAVRIPVTCIFRDGKPFKTLGCDELGIVKRISLENMELERTDSEKGFRGQSVRTIRALRKLLIDYSNEHGYAAAQLENNHIPIICNVSQLVRLLRYCKGKFLVWFVL